MSKHTYTLRAFFDEAEARRKLNHCFECDHCMVRHYSHGGKWYTVDGVCVAFPVSGYANEMTTIYEAGATSTRPVGRGTHLSACSTRGRKEMSDAPR